MLLLLLHYKTNIRAVDSHVLDHIKYLQKHYDLGNFLLSGRRIPRTGGVIIAWAEPEESLRTIIKEDPSSIHDGAEYQIISMLIPDLTVDKEEIPGHKTRNTPREPHLDLILGIDDTSEPGNQPVHPKKNSSHRNHSGFTKKDAADEDTTYQRLLSEGDFIHESHLSLGERTLISLSCTLTGSKFRTDRESVTFRLLLFES